MRAAAADLEFVEAGRLRDEIRKLEQEELGLPVDEHRAPVKSNSFGGKPGTRTTKYGKMKAARARR
jgi:excinuclease ABC subunit B